MKQNADKVIRNLTPEIDKKCDELKAIRKEKLQSRLFVILCVIIIFVPAQLVFFGVSLAVLTAPILFAGLCVVMLLPIMLNGEFTQGGETEYEQA